MSDEGGHTYKIDYLYKLWYFQEDFSLRFIKIWHFNVRCKYVKIIERCLNDRECYKEQTSYYHNGKYIRIKASKCTYEQIKWRKTYLSHNLLLTRRNDTGDHRSTFLECIHFRFPYNLRYYRSFLQAFLLQMEFNSLVYFLSQRIIIN